MYFLNLSCGHLGFKAFLNTRRHYIERKLGAGGGEQSIHTDWLKNKKRWRLGAMVLSMMSDSYACTRALQSTSQSNLNRSVSQNSPWDCASTRLRNLRQQLGQGPKCSQPDMGTTTRDLERPGRQTSKLKPRAPRVPECVCVSNETRQKAQDISDLNSLRRHHHCEL